VAQEEKRQILVSGLGGQGVLFATSILLEAARAKGWDAIASETHGMAQRGGSVVSHIKFGSLLSPLIRSGSADVLLSLNREEAFRNLHFVKRGGAVVVNAASLTKEQAALTETLRQREIEFVGTDATEVARSAGTARAGNVALLGAACKAGLLPFSADDLKLAITTLTKGPRRESNLGVLETALESK
jgi:indolepyruvate ferredoxin oxidoreductase beta subunit